MSSFQGTVCLGTPCTSLPPTTPNSFLSCIRTHEFPSLHDALMLRLLHSYRTPQGRGDLVLIASHHLLVNTPLHGHPVGSPGSCAPWKPPQGAPPWRSWPEALMTAPSCPSM